MILGFGKKYKDTDIRFVPVEYLEWILREADDEEVVERARDELQRKVDAGIIPFFEKGE